jgi:ATP-dependent DNA helicase DinG
MRFVEDAGGHSFGDYTLPLMTLTLKQGFGRLVRRSGDRGVVAILDDRLTTKGYGRRVRGDLPPAGFTRRFGDVHRFYRDALDAPADFALDVRAWRVEEDELEALGEVDAEPGIWWWWRLRRLQDGRADGGEGIEPRLGDTVAGEFHAAVLGLGNLRKRITAAKREPADFGVELRCSREVAGWIENPEELESDALGKGGPVGVKDWLAARAGWREVRVVGVPR